jgi:hypothetical protein
VIKAACRILLITDTSTQQGQAVSSFPDSLPRLLLIRQVMNLVHQGAHLGFEGSLLGSLQLHALVQLQLALHLHILCIPLLHQEPLSPFWGTLLISRNISFPQC